MRTAIRSVLGSIGRRLARFLSRPRGSAARTPAPTPEMLAEVLQPGDILLVEGTSRISEAIKYLTQSTWSHAAIYIGDALDDPSDIGTARVLLEADLNEGVRVVPLSVYEGEHTRICRPVGLDVDHRQALLAFLLERIGMRYDLRNIVDLARYLIRRPPVPQQYRRRMVALGSGDPTRAICSSLIAQAFQRIDYPILPYVDVADSAGCTTPECYAEQMHIRHHSLFAPRDFDISPYFAVIKPSLARGFDHRSVHWHPDSVDPAEAATPERSNSGMMGTDRDQRETA